MALRHLSMPMSPVSPVLPRAVSEQPCPPALRPHGSWLVRSVTAAQGCASCRGASRLPLPRAGEAAAPGAGAGEGHA